MLSAVFCFCSVISFAQGTWTAKASLGTATNGRSKAACFEIAGLAYVGTGYNGTAKNDFWSYDPVGNAWTQKANFGGSARFGAIGFSVNGIGYIGTGFSTPAYTKDMWKYNVAGNNWFQVADFGGAGRQDAACFVIGNTVYAGTGYNGTTVLNDFWKYNPTSDTWTSKANYAGTACASATGFSVDGKGYFCLGRNAANTAYYNTLYQYDTTANSWTSRANFAGTAREGAAAFVVAGNAYVGTGGSNNGGNLYTDFYKYDHVGNSWSAITAFSGSMRSHTCSFSIGNFGYVGMGYTGGQVNNLYQYNFCSVTNTVTPTPPSCNGGSNGSINLTLSNATAPYTYAWSNAATIEDITGLIAGNYSVVVTDSYGCTSTNTVTVSAPAVLSVSVTSSGMICMGATTTMNGSSSGGTNPYSYIWSTGATTQNITASAAGTYSIVVTDSKGCTASAFTSLTQFPAPTVTLASTPGSCSTCTNGTASATVSGGVTPYTYQWSPSGNTTLNATGLVPGNYTFCATDLNGCTTCSVVIVSSNNSIVEYDSPIISVYPNPSTGEFKVQGLKTNAELGIYNCLGELVYRMDLPRKQESVNATSLSFGIYFLKIKAEGNIFTKKIILTE